MTANAGFWFVNVRGSSSAVFAVDRLAKTVAKRSPTVVKQANVMKRPRFMARVKRLTDIEPKVSLAQHDGVCSSARHSGLVGRRRQANVCPISRTTRRRDRDPIALVWYGTRSVKRLVVI